MGTLNVGRVGLDVDLDDPQSWSQDSTFDGDIVSIAGFLRAASLADSKALRSELLAHVGETIPIVYETDPSVNGVFVLDGVEVDADWRDGALVDRGFFRFRLDATRIGSYSQTEFQSLLHLVDATEAHATDPSFWHSPPVGALAYDAGAGSPTLIERPTEDGDIFVAYDIPPTLTSATWSVDPATYYDGAAEVWAGGRLRSGLDMPMDPTDWYLSNGIMQFRPVVYQDVSNGDLAVRFYNGSSWGSWMGFQVIWDGANAIPRWHFVSIIRNTAAACTVRLVRDAAETVSGSDAGTTAKHELDITMRRGAPFVTCIYKYTGGEFAHAVARNITDASTRPGGDASYIYDTGLIDGDRWILGTPRAFDATAGTGRIDLDDVATSMPFWIGAAIDDASNASGNGPADLAEQYVGQVAETVRAVRR